MVAQATTGAHLGYELSASIALLMHKSLCESCYIRTSSSRGTTIILQLTDVTIYLVGRWSALEVETSLTESFRHCWTCQKHWTPSRPIFHPMKSSAGEGMIARSILGLDEHFVALLAKRRQQREDQKECRDCHQACGQRTGQEHRPFFQAEDGIRDKAT